MIEQYIDVFNLSGGGGTIDCESTKTYLQSVIGTNSYFMNFEIDGGLPPNVVAINPHRDEFYVAGSKYIQIWQLSTKTLITTLTGIGGGSNATAVCMNINSDGSKLCIAWRTWSRIEQYDLSTRTADWTTAVGINGGSQANTCTYSSDDLYVYWSWNSNNRVGRIDVSTGTNTNIDGLTSAPTANYHNDSVTYGGYQWWVGDDGVAQFDDQFGTYGTVSNLFSYATNNEFPGRFSTVNSIWIDDNYEILKDSRGTFCFYEKGSTFSNILFVEGLGAASINEFLAGGKIRGTGTFSGIDCFDTFIHSSYQGLNNTVEYYTNTGPNFLLKINDF